MTLNKYMLPILFIVISIFMVSCAPASKAPAAEAIKEAEKTFKAVKDEAIKYVPAHAYLVAEIIKIAESSFNKGDFDEALSVAKDVPEKVKELTVAIAAKKEELTENWEAISAEMSGMLNAIKEKLESLSTSKRLPKTLNKAKLEAAKADYEAATKAWDEVKSSSSEANMADAIAKAKTVKEKALEVMNNLGMAETPIKS